MIIGMGHCAVTVKDMDESVKFYSEGLGFKKVFDIAHPATGKPWIVYLNICKGQFIELFYDGTVDNPWRSELIGFNHLCFQVDDIHASIKQLRDAGYDIYDGPKTGADNNWQAWVMDPNGIRVELMQIDPSSPHGKYC